MNPIVAIIAILLVLGLLLFGSNPIESKRAMLHGKDPLVDAIEKYNASSHENMLGLHTPSRQETAGSLQGGTAAAPHYPPYMMKQQDNNPFAAANPYNRGLGQQPTQQAVPGHAGTATGGQNTDSYYPPPPAGEKGSPLQPPSAPHSEKAPGLTYHLSMDLPPQPLTNFTLKDGTKIRFNGVDVYTFDATGHPMPMPDGEYAMFDGAVQILVRDGKRVILRRTLLN